MASQSLVLYDKIMIKLYAITISYVVATYA